MRPIQVPHKTQSAPSHSSRATRALLDPCTWREKQFQKETIGVGWLSIALCRGLHLPKVSKVSLCFHKPILNILGHKILKPLILLRWRNPAVTLVGSLHLYTFAFLSALSPEWLLSIWHPRQCLVLVVRGASPAVRVIPGAFHGSGWQSLAIPWDSSGTTAGVRVLDAWHHWESPQNRLRGDFASVEFIHIRILKSRRSFHFESFYIIH